MITIKDYAHSKGITYEAVRAQLHRYAKELDGLIVKQGRTQFLTDEAVAFLDAKRASNPVVIKDMALDEELERLRTEKENLLVRVAALQELLIIEKDKVILLTEEKAELSTQLQLLQASSQHEAEDPVQAPEGKEDEVPVNESEVVQATTEPLEAPVNEQVRAVPPQAKRSLLENLRAAFNKFKKD